MNFIITSMIKQNQHFHISENNHRQPRDNKWSNLESETFWKPPERNYWMFWNDKNSPNIKDVALDFFYSENISALQNKRKQIQFQKTLKKISKQKPSKTKKYSSTPRKPPDELKSCKKWSGGTSELNLKYIPVCASMNNIKISRDRYFWVLWFLFWFCRIFNIFV